MENFITKRDFRQLIREYIRDFVYHVLDRSSGWGSSYYSQDKLLNIAQYLKNLDPDTVTQEEILIAESTIFIQNTKAEHCSTCRNETYNLYEIKTTSGHSFCVCDICIDTIYKFKEKHNDNGT